MMEALHLDLPAQLREMPLFHNSLLQWAIALGVAAVLLMVLTSLRGFIRSRYRAMQATEHVELLEVPFQILSRTTFLFFLILSLVVGFSTLTMADGTRTFLTAVFMTVLFIQIGIWASAAVFAWFDRRSRRMATAADRAVVGSLGIIGFIVRVVIWSFVGLLILDNLGVDVTALVAGLGIGGIAVALAAQNILGDLFASLSIAFDKPFLVGDFLILDDYLGSVEHIGIKSTRLRSLSGEQIVMSNADLLKSRVRNYGRMMQRRVVMAHRITYETSLENLELAPRIIREAIENREKTRFDRAHFAKHGEAAIELESVYYVLSADYNVYMDIQQEINLEIHRRFAEHGIHFALPVRRVLLETQSRADEEEEPAEASPA